MASCVNITLSGITMQCEPSKGGLKKVWIAPYKDNEFTISGGTVSAVASGTTFYTYNFRKNSSNFTTTMNIDDANGVQFSQTEINLVFSRMNAEKRVELASLALGDLMVVAQDSNGTYFAFGTDEPVRATGGTGETGTQKSDGNKYTIVLTADEQSYPYTLSPAAVTQFLELVQETA